MTKIYMILWTLMGCGMVSHAQDDAGQGFDPGRVCSMEIPEGWSLVGEDKRIMPKRPKQLAEGSEWVADDKSRVFLVVFKKDGFPKQEKEVPLASFTISLVKGFVGASDAKAVREVGIGRMGGLDSSNLHIIQSKGKVLIETYISVAQDDKHYYAVIGVYKVGDFRKRGVEILRMIHSFELVKKVE